MRQVRDVFIPHLFFVKLNISFATRNSQLATRNSQLATRNPQPATRNSQLGEVADDCTPHRL